MSDVGLPPGADRDTVALALLDLGLLIRATPEGFIGSFGVAEVRVQWNPDRSVSVVGPRPLLTSLAARFDARVGEPPAGVAPAQWAALPERTRGACGHGR